MAKNFARALRTNIQFSTPLLEAVDPPLLSTVHGCFSILYQLQPHIFQIKYAHHYSFLVYGMHFLLGSDISSDQLALADQLLQSFYQHMPDLYGDESCKMNIHYLVHLSSFVRMWGPSVDIL